MSTSSQNGWNEYSKLVIAELERLNEGINSLNSEIQDLKKEITEIKVKEDNVRELKSWKSSLDEVTRPTQSKEIIKDVADRKTFKTQAVTVWLVVQVLFGITMALLRYFG